MMARAKAAGKTVQTKTTSATAKKTPEPKTRRKRVVKKASPDTQVTEAAEQEKAQALQEKATKTKTALEKEVEDTRKILQSRTFSENEYMATYGHMFDRLIEITQKTEKDCLEAGRTTKHIYALMQLYNQLRELIHDIRTISDSAQQGHVLVSDVIRPTFSDIGQNVGDMIYYLKRDLREHLNGDTYKEVSKKLEHYASEHGRFLQGCYHRSSEQVMKIFTEK